MCDSWKDSSIDLNMLQLSISTEMFYLYGKNGSHHSKYLGCFGFSGNDFTPEVSDYNSDSIFNEYGTYGNQNKNSIWNEYREFGSSSRSTSCTNEHATEPPAIFDRNNRIVGYLTANKYLSGQTDLGRRISRALRLQ